MKRSAARRGFTLLEVLLAVAIFVGATAVLSRLLVLGIENAEYADWHAQAWLVAESAWTELESGIHTLNESGPFPVEGMEGWQWSADVQTTDIPSLYRVTIRVEKFENGPGEGTSIELTRLYFDDASEETEPTS